MAKSKVSRPAAVVSKPKSSESSPTPAPSDKDGGSAMTFAEIRELVQLVATLGVDEVVVRNPNQVVKVVAKRGVMYASPAPAAPAHVASAAPTPSAAPAGPSAATPAAAAGSGETASPTPAVANPSWKRINAPMVGTFYRAASPEAGPFVQVGDRVDEESVLCIIEAMKLMNEIKAEMRGTVREIVAENGRPVEYGQPMFLIEPA